MVEKSDAGIDFLLSFFENLDEMVYISDRETNELIYMNRHLRCSLGYERHEEYRGKKCYEILQGSSAPCAFCTNQALEKEKFLSWTHKNPVLNKRYLIKDSLILRDGKQYRIEIAIDVDSEVVCNTPYYYARSETILNECLQRVFSTTDPEEGLELMMAYLGETFQCDRVYVFETDGNGQMDNTYEWCAQDVAPQKEILQKMSTSSIDWWMKLFGRNQVVLINDLEEIRTQYPVSYAILKPQGIKSLAAGPVSVEGKVVGFLGVDDPSREMMNMLPSILNVIGCFVATLLQRRDLLRRLNVLSFHDPLTGAYNRNAMSEHSVRCGEKDSLGVIYCDITGLKQTNDSQGHNAGDQLICHCNELLQQTLETPWIYRSGGDEFVAVFYNTDEETFRQNVHALHDRIWQDECHIAVGYAWSDQKPFSLDMLISQADKVMYQDKREYYAANSSVPGIERRKPDKASQGAEADSRFRQFLKDTYHDEEFFFNSISRQNAVSYFYFGDIQKNLFYVSDNMRDEFGFQSNVVIGLLQEWTKRISTQRYRQLHQEKIRELLSKKETVYDLRYQVRNTAGKSIWVRCYALLEWNEDKTRPLFFSGRVTHQDDTFVVDPVTNLPRGSALARFNGQPWHDQEKRMAIGFCLNSVTELNSTRGRAYSDHLIRGIADELTSQLAGKLSFYRLEGLRFIALTEDNCRESKESLVKSIRDIITAEYRARGLSVHRPSSFAVMEYPQPHLSITDFLENMVSLIKVAKNDPKQPFIDDSSANISKIKQISNMALALEHDVFHKMENFRLVVQPVVSAASGKVVGGEALLRWSFEGREVSPAVFIPMLEKDHLIQTAGRWVFEQAVCVCMRLVACIPDFYLTFNVSLQQLSDETFTDFMKKTMDKYYLDGSHLIAEMTESCMDEQPENLLHFVDACKSMGIQIALDDFGSGYSSLRMLLQYPSNMIKLDRSLLAEMTKSEDKMNFISSIVYACHRFGKKVCMEGVETDVQNVLIRESGCDMIQGYYYYHPMELDDVYRLISSSATSCRVPPVPKQTEPDEEPDELL